MTDSGTAELLGSTEKALALYLGDSELTPLPPGEEAQTKSRTITPVFPMADDVQDPSRTSLDLSEPDDPALTLPSTCAALSRAPASVRVIPPAPAPTTEIPGPTGPLPTPIPPGTYPSSSGAFCDPIWGNWTAPFPFTPIGPRQTSHLSKLATLHLWLNATHATHLAYLEVSLRRSSGSSFQDLYVWRYHGAADDLVDPDRVLETGRSLRNSATDAETGRPLLLIANRSTPLTLTAEPAPLPAAGMRVQEGQRIELFFRQVNVTSANLTYVNDTAARAANDVRVEFGSLDRLSYVSAFLDPTSVFANAGVLGLFLDTGGKLSFQSPDRSRIAEELPVEWSPTFDRSENITLGTAFADDAYELLGAAQAYLWVKLSPQAKATNQWVGPVATIQVEIDLIIGGKIVTTSGETFRIGIGASCHIGCNDNAKENRKDLLKMAIPVAGIKVPRGTEIKIQARLVGVTDPRLVVASIVYGGTYTWDPFNNPPKREYVPSGFKIPAIYEGQRLTIDPEALVRPVVVLPNGGAGAYNGTYAFETDRRQANTAQGGSVRFDVLLKNFNTTLADYRLTASDPPSDVRVQVEGGEGRILAGGFAYAAVTLAVPASRPLGSFEVRLGANFTSSNATGVPTTTRVGPLPLTIVVDSLASAPGQAAPGEAPRKAPAKTPADKPAAADDPRFRLISEPAKPVPGMEAWALVVIGLGLAAYPGRRRG